MKEFNAEETHFESVSALDTLGYKAKPTSYAAYIGLDVHKETLVVSVARPGREAAQMWGEIANRPKAVAKLVDRLNREFGAEVLLFCYEAGPCGYGL